MPQSDNRVIDMKTPGVVFGSTNSALTHTYQYRIGTKYRTGDVWVRPVRALLSRSAKGWVTRAASPPGAILIPFPGDGGWPYFGKNQADQIPEFNPYVNKSWDRMMDRVRGESSQLGASIGEGRESFMMIANRVTSTYRAYKELKRGNFRRFLRELSVDPRRKHRSWQRTSSKEASGLWLEYSFGWKPMIQDVFDSAVTLSSPHVTGWYRETGSAWGFLDDSERTLANGASGTRVLQTQKAKAIVKQGAYFRVNNENAFLANRLGLVNPVSVAWELVPFSFVVDWFSGIGNWIAGYTDLHGLSVRDPFTVHYLQARLHGRAYLKANPGNSIETLHKGYWVERRTGLSRPVPIVPKVTNFGTSVTRAANAVSLMIQVLIKP